MSDNPSDSQQQAVAQTEKSAKKMTASSTGNELDGSVSTSPERTEGSNGSEEDKHKDEDVVTTKQKADAAEALAAVADAIKAKKGTKATKTSPKKRTTASNDEKEESPKKKRAAAKGKAANSEVEIKNEEVKVEGTTSASNHNGFADVTPEGSGADEEHVPVTPMKGKRTATAATPRTPKTPKSSIALKHNDGTPVPKTTTKATPRKRSQADKVADKVSLPTTWAAAGEPDKELVAMKKDGKSWNEIRAMWLEKTGQETATSTLPNRYKRLQFVMMQLDDGEKAMLQQTKDEVEANWKNSKWGLIATEMEKKGANKYHADFLLKEWKKMEITRAENEAAAATAAATAATAATAAGGNALLAAAQQAVENADEGDEEAEDEAED